MWVWLVVSWVLVAILLLALLFCVILLRQGYKASYYPFDSKRYGLRLSNGEYLQAKYNDGSGRNVRFDIPITESSFNLVLKAIAPEMLPHITIFGLLDDPPYRVQVPYIVIIESGDALPGLPKKNAAIHLQRECLELQIEIQTIYGKLRIICA